MDIFRYNPSRDPPRDALIFSKSQLGYGVENLGPHSPYILSSLLIKALQKPFAREPTWLLPLENFIGGADQGL